MPDASMLSQAAQRLNAPPARHHVFCYVCFFRAIFAACRRDSHDTPRRVFFSPLRRQAPLRQYASFVSAADECLVKMFCAAELSLFDA